MPEGPRKLTKIIRTCTPSLGAGLTRDL